MFKSNPIEKYLKNKAKKIKKQTPNISLMQAQNLVAEMHGFKNWHNLKENIKNIPLEIRIPSHMEEHYQRYDLPERERYIYSTTQNIPSKGEVILGFNNNSNLNVWSSKETFTTHSVYFCQTKTKYHYDIISQFYKDNKSFILIDDDEKYINKIVCENPFRKIIHLNETKIKSPSIHPKELLNIIFELYRLEHNQLSSDELEILKEKIEQSIFAVFNGEKYLNMNKELILKIKIKIEDMLNDKKYQLENFFENIIKNFIYDDKGIFINLKENDAFFVKSPTNNDKSYYYFNLFFSWYLTNLSLDYFKKMSEEPESEYISHELKNAAIFYFNPFFSKETYDSTVASKMRGLRISLNYYIPVENAQRNNDCINYCVIPNAGTILFERVNNNISEEEKYYSNELIRNNRKYYIKMDNGKKILYSHL